MMQEILIISNYYPPEKGAAANRIGLLAKKLQQNGYKVSVLCPLANYPEGKIIPEQRGKFSVNENDGGISVKRLWIYPSVSKNIFRRILSICSFLTGLALYLIFTKTPQKIIVQSPPLLLSFITVGILSFKTKKIILNVSDLWPLAAIELGALKRGSLAHRFALFMERSLYMNAHVILGQSDEILTHIRKTVAGKKLELYRNFPDHEATEIPLSTTNIKKIFYAGLLGVAQGVYKLCREIEISHGIELHVFGDGPEKADIEELIASHAGKNIFFHGMLSRKALHERLSTFDIALVPLAVRIYGSVPSKIFEYTTLGFPVLYFGGGEGEQIVIDNHLGWTAPPGDYNALNETIRAIEKLKPAEMKELKARVYKTSSSRFNLNVQMETLVRNGIF